MEEEARGASGSGKARATGNHGGDVPCIACQQLSLDRNRSSGIRVCCLYQRLACDVEVDNEYGIDWKKLHCKYYVTI